jgi:hypothetical protein
MNCVYPQQNPRYTSQGGNLLFLSNKKKSEVKRRSRGFSLESPLKDIAIIKRPVRIIPLELMHNCRNRKEEKKGHIKKDEEE